MRKKILLRMRDVNGQQGKAMFEQFIQGLSRQVEAEVGRMIGLSLGEEVRRVLGRETHQRREKVERRRVSARCAKCGSTQRQRFSRNGYRVRQVVTLWGVLRVELPRVRCECGGSVEFPFTLLAPYQRVWADVDERIQQWGEMGLSLRQMQAELAEGIGTSIGLRTLNERLQAIKGAVQGALTAVPPVVMLDAIWVKLLAPTGQLQADRLGRRRPQKRKRSAAVLVALGVWPQTGQWEVLDWELATGEDQAGWERLLVRLETRGLYAERGVQLFIHDGGKGLEAALRLIFPYIRRQRCVFHKLRNVWQAIGIPEGLDRDQARSLRTQIIREAAAIYRAADEFAARTRLRLFVQAWSALQPDMVRTLQRDVDDTLRFYDLLRRFPHWHAESLRTTSLLERLNRHLRRLFRAAGTYHSERGLAAATARVLLPYVAV